MRSQYTVLTYKVSLQNCVMHFISYLLENLYERIVQENQDSDIKFSIDSESSDLQTEDELDGAKQTPSTFMKELHLSLGESKPLLIILEDFILPQFPQTEAFYQLIWYSLLIHIHNSFFKRKSRN